MVEIIILNFNALEPISFCLEALKICSKNEHKITVIDNASTDGSVEWLKMKKGIKLVLNDKNLLFTDAYSKYLDKADLPEFFVIMNNDIVVEKHWDEPLFKFMYENPKCAIAAPMLVGLEGSQIQNMGGLEDFCSHKIGQRGIGYSSPEENLWTTFACVMIRTSAFKEVGGFDNQFKFYCSDSDLCLKLHFAGYKVFNIPKSVARHYHGYSTKMAGNKEIMNIGFNDQRLFGAKWEFCGIKLGEMKELIRGHSLV